MEKELFEHRVQALWPKATIHVIVSLNSENHFAVAQLGADKPFFVGLKHGHPVPVSVSTILATQERLTAVLDNIQGALDLSHALDPTPKDYTAFNKLLGIPTDR